MTIPKQEFIKRIIELIKATDTDPVDAVIVVAEQYGIDMESAAKIVNSNSNLKQLVEAHARVINVLK